MYIKYPQMDEQNSFSKTLGPVSAKFITTLQKQGKTAFSIQEAQSIYGKNNNLTSAFLSDLIKRGILARIRPGRFLILQAGNESTQLKNWPIIARELAGEDAYYLSHQSAMRLHGMTSHFSLDVYLTTLKQKPEKTVDKIRYHFVYSSKKHFWGESAHWLTKHEQLRVSDLERTVLDGFDRPELCGGVSDVARGLWSVQKKIDPVRLVEYAARFRSKAAVKRLGFILEALEIVPDAAAGLHRLIVEAKDYIPLDPQAGREGPKKSRWRIRENIRQEQLRSDVWG